MFHLVFSSYLIPHIIVAEKKHTQYWGLKNLWASVSVFDPTAFGAATVLFPSATPVLGSWEFLCLAFGFSYFSLSSSLQQSVPGVACVTLEPQNFRPESYSITAWLAPAWVRTMLTTAVSKMTSCPFQLHSVFSFLRLPSASHSPRKTAGQKETRYHNVLWFFKIYITNIFLASYLLGTRKTVDFRLTFHF
jgi:uncharacterized membrane protein